MCWEVRVFLESEVYVHGLCVSTWKPQWKTKPKAQIHTCRSWDQRSESHLFTSLHFISLHFTCANLFTQFSLCATFIRFQKGSFRLLYDTEEKKALFSNGHVDVQSSPTWNSLLPWGACPCIKINYLMCVNFSSDCCCAFICGPVRSYFIEF